MKYALFSALFLVILFACHKQPETTDPLPLATQEGKNTFGCYINGAPWVAGIAPYVLDPTLHKIEAEYDELEYGNDYGRFLSLKGHRTNDSTDGFMAINLKPVHGIGEISHPDAEIFDVSALIVRTNHGQYIDALGFKLDTLFDYKIEITYLNTEKNIISGKFYFTGTSAEDTVNVTDGRFDIKYSPE